MASFGNMTIKTVNNDVGKDNSRRSQVRDEVLVVFETAEARDAVRSSAAQLSRCAAPAGMILDIPQFLRSDFRALENTGYRIRKKSPGARTNIKFDDINMTGNFL